MQNEQESSLQGEQQRLSEELLATCEQLQEENERFRQDKKVLEQKALDLEKKLNTSHSDYKAIAYREAKLREELNQLMEKQHRRQRLFIVLLMIFAFVGFISSELIKSFSNL